MLSTIRNVIIALFIGLLVGFIAGYKYKSNNDKAAIAAASQRAATVTTKVITKYVTVQAKAQIVYKTILKKVPYEKVVYIQGKQVNSPITLSAGFVSLWNSALLSKAPTRAADATTDSGITLQTALSNESINAQRCNANSAQLKALITWLKNTKS